jgi:hypothetical protein
MIPLLYCALADTVIDYAPEDMVIIHEWGVIEVHESYLDAKGCPYGYIDEQGYFREYPEVEVTAPVVYFHGSECSGTFSVDVFGGCFTTMIPYPDSISNSSVFGLEGQEVYTAVWQDLKITPDETGEDTITGATEVTRGPAMPDCFAWAVPFWQAVPANRVYYDPAGYSDVFVYYESYMYDPGMFLGEYYNHSGDALVFFAEDGQLTCVKVLVPGEADARGETLSDLEIMTVLCGWGHNRLKSEEISALWNTWKPLLRTRCELEGQTLMLFPLTYEQTEAISRLRFDPVENLLVEVDRLLLGLGPI